MELNFVLDTNAVIYAQQGKLAEPLPTGRYFASIISEIELLSFPLLNSGQRNALLAMLRELTILNINQDIKQRAIDLRSSHRLRTPDAIIAATALSVDAELVTNDVAMQSIPNLRCHEMKLLMR